MVYIRVPKYYDQYPLYRAGKESAGWSLVGGELLTISEYKKLVNTFANTPDLRGYGVRIPKSKIVWFFGVRLPAIVSTGRITGDPVSWDEVDEKLRAQKENPDVYFRRAYTDNDSAES